MALHRRTLLKYLTIGTAGTVTATDRVRARRHSERVQGRHPTARDASGQPGLRWQRHYPDVQDFIVAEQLPDGDYVLGGYTSQGNPMVVAVTADGEERWRWFRKVDGSLSVHSVQSGDDGSAVIGGERRTDDVTEAVVQWFDDGGTLVRSETFGRSEARANAGHYPLQLGRFGDGSYVLIYHRNGDGSNDVHPVVVGFDESGDETWRFDFDRGEAMYVRRLVPGPNGTVRLAGAIRGLDHDGWLATVDPNGEHEFASLAVPVEAAAADGDSIVVAVHRSGEDGSPLRVQKVHGNGAVEWRRRHDVGGSHGTVTGITAVPGGGYALVVADPWARGSCPGSIVVRLTAEGDLSWDNCYVGADALLYSWVILARSPREFVLVGAHNGGWVGSFVGDDELTLVRSPEPATSPTSTGGPSPSTTPTTTDRDSSPVPGSDPSPSSDDVVDRSPSATPSGTTPPEAETTPGFGLAAGLAGVGATLLAWLFRNR